MMKLLKPSPRAMKKNHDKSSTVSSLSQDLLVEVAMRPQDSSIDSPLPQDDSSIVGSLPQDLLVEVALRIASKSPTPLEDVKRLRATCKLFYRASKDKLVGRSFAVDKLRSLKWGNNASSLPLLRNCADCGNPNANFILGFEQLYNARNAILGLQHLEQAMEVGHLTSAYLMGMVLFRHAATRSDAMKILSKVSSGDLSGTANVTECTRSCNPIVDKCRKEVLEMRESCWKKEWEMKSSLPCKHHLCGNVVNEEHWANDNKRPRAFCSQLCRWTYEAYTLFGTT